MSGDLDSSAENATFLIDKLAEECSSLQWLRELTQNGIDAIRPPGSEVGATGSLVWDIDERLAPDGLRKISITDDGCGMTGEQMVRLLNKLASSGRVQGRTDNFGIGAKIACARRSPAGVLYQSWVDGVGTQILWRRNPATNKWGLYQWDLGGTYSHYAPVPDDDKPAMISQHGTKVTLFGMGADDDTLAPPPDTPAPSGWVLKWLNSRYFRFPGGVSIKAIDGIDETGSVHRRTVRGMESWLTANSQSYGVQRVAGANVRWWIINGEDHRSDSSRFLTSGHTAALFQDELYEVTSGTTARRRLQEFGVTFGTGRVVIYVEPTTLLFAPNSARSMLMQDGEGLPWGEWADQFRENLPAELAAFVEEVGAKSLSSSGEGNLRKKIAPFLDILQGTTHPVIALKKAGDSDAFGGRVHVEGHASSRSMGPSVPSAAKDALGGLLRAGTRQVKPAKSVDPYPAVAWVSAADGTREADDLLQRAGRYLPGSNLVQMSADFPFFLKVIDAWYEEYAHRVPRAAIEAELRRQVELLVVQRTIAITTMRGQAAWNDDDVARALSEEAITAIVMDPYWLGYSMGRALGTVFGRREALRRPTDARASA